MRRSWLPWLLLIVLLSSGSAACIRFRVPTQPPPLPVKAIQTHNTKSGFPRWIYKFKEPIVSTPAISGKDWTIYVTTLDNSLHAIVPGGRTKWPKPFKTRDIMRSSPATALDGSGAVYITSFDGRLYSVVDRQLTSPIMATSYATGKRKRFQHMASSKWSHFMGGKIDSTPWATSDGDIYVATRKFKLVAMTSDGSEKWTYDKATDAFERSTPAIGPDGTIYVASRNGVLHAVRSNGKQKWAESVPGCKKITSSPRVDTDGNVFIGCWNGMLHAIRSNGKPRWKVSLKGSKKSKDSVILATPYLRNGVIYIGSDSGWFFAIDASTGKIKWKFQTGRYVKKKDGSWKRIVGSSGYIQASALVVPKTGRVYFGSVNEYFYCLSKDGKLLWQFDARGWVDKAPRLGRAANKKDFVIYLAAGRNLYALNP